MVESIYFLKPAWCGAHFAGLWPEQGFQPVTRATALRRWFVTCVDIPQTIAGLTAATKHFIGLYMNRKLAHGNNPILNWHASCLALVTDGGDNCKPRKPPRDTAAKRIDGVAATITALARALFAEDNTINLTGLRSVG